jgi:hypothetical protein
MITRGLIIGKVVDDLANLKYQIETRNRLGQLDLTKFCEDFARELLNITYDTNLQNLNKTRSNNPGLDLGDEKNKIAYQITSQKTSAKINETLAAITAEQKDQYDNIKVFILGEKQTSYTLDDDLVASFGFVKESDIVDIDSLLRDIVLLDIEKLDIIYSLFQREFRQVKIELEPLDEKGNFESSYYNVTEKKPAKPAENGILFIGVPDKHYEREKDELDDLYETLSSVPRVTREILAIIVEKGKFESDFGRGDRYGIIPAALEKFMKLTENELMIELNILIDAGLLSISEKTVGHREIPYLVLSGETQNLLYNWLIEEKHSVRTVLNTMDFTILDE